MVYILYLPWDLEKLGVANVLLNDDIILQKNRPCTRLGTSCPLLIVFGFFYVPRSYEH